MEEKRGEPEIVIKCSRETPQIQRIAAALRRIGMQIPVMEGDCVRLLDAAEVYYMEVVDGKSFVYTAEKVYESWERLYEFERQLGQCRFLRIHKSCIVNLEKIKSIKAYVGRRLLITLDNEEQLIASRQYAAEIKGWLGVK